jgi:hypothetical protein
MNRFLMIIALAGLATLSVSAGTVTFDTTGSQLCIGAIGCGTTSVTFGDTILTYNAVATPIVTPPSNVDLGYLSTSCVGGGTSCTLSGLPAGLALYLNINQTVPASGSAGISSGMITGSISGSGSTAFISWGGLPSVSIVAGSLTTTYAIANSPLAIVPPSTNNCPACTIQPSGATTIQGNLTQSPEPGSILLLSTGLLGLGFARKRLS